MTVISLSMRVGSPSDLYLRLSITTFCRQLRRPEQILLSTDCARPCRRCWRTRPDGVSERFERPAQAPESLRIAADERATGLVRDDLHGQPDACGGLLGLCESLVATAGRGARRRARRAWICWPMRLGPRMTASAPPASAGATA